ncbi:hypothetical protein K493DRAFT_334426 [Basidiobolus meristosporus CBS 931.73]|uniref:Myb-like domain-containing protein n=1 Tax=Basidiobolus meristosporus CBS 931.73 TaxID=1314790 RepID=A0A1Y1YYB0_9FUNG|nr:hypothetical protein K493DRAFT_334426 [Basidiobolus meristosporus CBS 931.73]|eukprot:ORY03011.1 hypothetical protein K493DRAFT_334426 [Basidiobolus meristosporus CBS 931.73]
MDDLLLYVLEEIGVEGDSGCPLPSIWKFFEEYYSTACANSRRKKSGPDPEGPQVFDISMKSYIWQILRRMDEVTFINLVEEEASNKGKTRGRKPKNTKSPEKPSTKTAAFKTEIKSMSLDEVEQYYGSKLKVVASADLQRKALYGHQGPSKEFSSMISSVLRRIARGRTLGATQADIAKDLSMDPRSVFHFIKVLCEMKLVVKCPVVTRGTYTNLCLHIRYAHLNPAYLATMPSSCERGDPVSTLESEKDSIRFHYENSENNPSSPDTGVSFHSDLVRQKLTEILGQALNKVMVAQDLMDALGLDTATVKQQRKWFNRTIDILVKQKYIERINVPRKDKGYDRCFRLLRPYVPNSQNNTSPLIPSKPQALRIRERLVDISEDFVSEPSPARDQAAPIIQKGVLADLPFEYQVYRLIQLSGDDGITAGAIQESLSNINNRLLQKILTRLLKPPADAGQVGICRVAEFVGRERRYRYYSTEAFKRLEEEDGITSEMRKVLNGNTPSRSRRDSSKHAAVSTRTSTPTPNDDRMDVDEIVCKVCHKGDDDSHILLCDHCNEGQHTYCSNPPLKAIPKGNWFCSKGCKGKGPAVEESENEEPVKTNGDTAVDKVPVTPDRKIVPVASASSTSHLKSITAVRRRKLLLQLLEEKKILELSYLLIKSYQDLLASQLGTGAHLPHTIDKRTLARTATSLEEENLLTQYTVKLPLLNGTYNTKILFLHPSLTPQSPEVKEYVALMRDRIMLVGSTFKPPKIEEENIEVERLEDMRKRIGSTVQTPTSSQSRLDTSPTTPAKSNPSSDMWWLSTAQDYGWINAKMVRAKLLHQFLISKINSQLDQDALDDSARVFQTSMLFTDLTLDLYLKIIGHTTQNTELTNYIKGNNDLSTRVIDLPHSIRTAIFGGNYKYRRQLKQLLDILVALEILKPVARDFDEQGNVIYEGLDEMNDGEFETSFQIVSSAYQLPLHVRMFDYSFPGANRNVIREYVLETIQDVTIYWSELQYVALQKVAERANVGSDNEAGNSGDSADESGEDGSKSTPKRGKAEKAEDGDAKNDPLYHITNPRNWQSSYPFTTHQRSVLESYVNRRKGLTPLEDEVKCRQIAAKLSLHVQRVKFFFKRIQDDHERKLMKKRERQASAALEATRKHHTHEGLIASSKMPDGESAFRKKRRDTIRERLLKNAASASFGSDSTPPNKSRRRGKNTPGESSQSSIGRRSQREKLRKQQEPITNPGLMENEENLPVIGDEERFESQYESISRRYRSYWSPQEDEMLLHAYVILRYRARRSKFLWASITQVFPERVSENCRRRINVLLRNTRNQDRVNSLVIHWEALYHEGLKTGAFVDEDDVDMIDFDLKGQLEYFMSALRNLPTHDPIPSYPLPRNPAILESIFDPSYVSSTHREDVYFEDQVEFAVSLRGKMTVMYAHPFILRTKLHDNLDLVSEDVDENKIQRELIKALVKMILMTPEDQYDSSHAFSILNIFPHNQIVEALEDAKEAGTIVKVKGGFNRRIPGRGFHVSDKFLSVLTGTFPERMLPQATAFHHHIKGPLVFSPLANSGTMACLLNLLSNSKITLSPVYPESVNEAQIVPNHKSRKIDHRRLDFSVCITPIVERIAEIDEQTPSPIKAIPGTVNLTRKRPLEDSHSIDSPTPKRYKSSFITPSIDDSSDIDENLLIEEVKSQYEVDEDRFNVQRVFDCIKTSGKLGITLLSLAKAIKNEDIVMDDAILQAYLGKLESASPPLIGRVGFNTFRYVTQEFLSFWMVDTAQRTVCSYSRSQTPIRSTGTPAPELDFSSLERSPRVRDPFSRITVHRYAPARMWYDINGNTVETVLRACSEAVLGYIIQKPGVYESNIHRKFALVMSRCELQDILQVLLSRGAIQRKAIIQPPKVTLFSKPRVFESSDPNTINENTITCYWGNPDFYFKTK